MSALNALIGAVERVLYGANIVGVVLDGVITVPRFHGINSLCVFLVLPLITRVAYLTLAHLVSDIYATVYDLLDATVRTRVCATNFLEGRLVSFLAVQTFVPCFVKCFGIGLQS